MKYLRIKSQTFDFFLYSWIKAIKNLAITSPFENGEIEINGFIMTNRYLIHFQCCKMQIILTYRITAPITYPLIDLNNLMME